MIGGSLSYPATRYPNVFGQYEILHKYVSHKALMRTSLLELTNTTLCFAALFSAMSYLFDSNHYICSTMHPFRRRSELLPPHSHLVLHLLCQFPSLYLQYLFIDSSK